MIPIKNIQKNKLERVNKLILIQQLNEKPITFFKFEENSDILCLIDTQYVISKQLGISYFFTHYFRKASPTNVADIELNSFISTNKISEDTISVDSDSSDRHKRVAEFYDVAWRVLNKIKERFTPKELLALVLERNIKII